MKGKKKKSDASFKEKKENLQRDVEGSKQIEENDFSRRNRKKKSAMKIRSGLRGDESGKGKVTQPFLEFFSSSSLQCLMSS